MSIALEGNTSNHQIDRSGFIQGMSCIPIYDSPDPGRFVSTDRIFPSARERENDSCSESSSSSIGRNSDDDLSAGRSSSNGDVESGDGEEVQSQFKGALDSMDALEEVLPVKRGLSKFYGGKSKSFTSLRDAASCSSTKDIVKPENAYTRKRKNLLAYSNFWDKSRNHLSRNNSGGISKRLANSGRSTLALGVTMSSTQNNKNSESSNSNSSPPSRCLPPLPPQNRRPTTNESPSTPLIRNLSSWRSFSLSDLQCAAAAAAAPSITSLVINNRDEDKLY